MMGINDEVTALKFDFACMRVGVETEIEQMTVDETIDTKGTASPPLSSVKPSRSSYYSDPNAKPDATAQAMVNMIQVAKGLK